mmetsp:Transcript_16272/g.35244  ORF Transcript_16272/g.35244 Transcript_16272/m.35244 type:complete len:538 (-) Transcript_16272:81-1694(-)
MSVLSNSALLIVFVLLLSCCHAAARISSFLERRSDSWRLLAALEHRQSGLLSIGNDAQSCASLRNDGPVYTVRVSVGTPPQPLDVVADTGSDSVIVSSCFCVEQGRCNEKNKCFSGKKSSTFSLEGTDGKLLSTQEDAKVKVVVLTFGSGKIESAVSTDVVQVGTIKAEMDGGLLLMIDQALNLQGPFEGILGLGLPRKKTVPLLETNATRSPQITTESFDTGFLQTAGIERFSMCFNEAGKDGLLRLGQPKPNLVLGSVGKVHWGLDFRGITVVPAQKTALAQGVSHRETSTKSLSLKAVASVKSSFCNMSSMKPGQETPCGIIPDSGTTFIMAPAEHLAALFSDICDAWPKCAATVQDKAGSKLKAVESLLQDCDEWPEGEGIEQMPTLQFHVAGSAGQEQTLELPPNRYVMAVQAQEVKYVKHHLAGIIDITEEVPTGKEVKVCTPTFGKQEYQTEKNGPVWILGTPLFYEYEVGYEMKSDKPGISFEHDNCGQCTESGKVVTAMLGRAGDSRSSIMTLKGAPRVPDRDLTQPL